MSYTRYFEKEFYVTLNCYYYVYFRYNTQKHVFGTY